MHNKILKDEKGNNIIQYFTDTNKYATYSLMEGQSEKDWHDLPNQSIRNKWESVETPIFSKDRKSILNLM